MSKGQRRRDAPTTTPTRRRRRRRRRADDDALLRRLRPAADRVASADAGLHGLVELLRGRQVRWARIGEALGVSRQAAWERFG
jgi:hypothetical protein